MNVLDELRAIGVEVIPQGKNLAIRPASKVPLELKERLRQHKAEVLAILNALPVKEQAKATACRYDWIAGYRGLRLHCVTHCHQHGTATVFRATSGGRDTLAEMLAAGVLMGQALADAWRVN